MKSYPRSCFCQSPREFALGAGAALAQPPPHSSRACAAFSQLYRSKCQEFICPHRVSSYWLGLPDALAWAFLGAGQQVIAIWAAKGQQGPELVPLRAARSWPQEGGNCTPCLAIPLGGQAKNKGLSDTNPAWQQRGRWGHANKSTGGPVALLHLTLTPNSLLRFMQTPTVVFGFNKAFFLPSSSTGDPKNSFEDKVRRRHRPTSLWLSFKVHIKPSGQLAICALPENRTRTLSLSLSPA